MEQNVDQNGFAQQQINQFMTLAIQQAKKAIQCEEIPVGCVFVTKTKQQPKWRVIASSHNLTNTCKNATRHCQINCMHQMQNKLTEQQRQKLVLFVTVQPCIMCTYALNIFKVKFVYFGQFNDKFGGCGSVLKRNEFQFQGGIMEEQSYQLIKGFYERGNQRISEDMRNRRSKKVKVENYANIREKQQKQLIKKQQQKK